MLIFMKGSPPFTNSTVKLPCLGAAQVMGGTPFNPRNLSGFMDSWSNHLCTYVNIHIYIYTYISTYIIHNTYNIHVNRPGQIVFSTLHFSSPTIVTFHSKPGRPEPQNPEYAEECESAARGVRNKNPSRDLKKKGPAPHQMAL